jgi:hypothetical protein
MTYKYDEFKWFIGRNLDVPDSIIIEYGDTLEIKCVSNYDEWDFENPIYDYICNYGDGNVEKVSIPLETIIEESMWYKNNNLYEECFDKIGFVLERCIYMKLKLLGNYE